MPNHERVARTGPGIDGERARRALRPVHGARPVDGRRTGLHGLDPRDRLREWRAARIPRPRRDDRPRLSRLGRRRLDAPTGGPHRTAAHRLQRPQLRRQLRSDRASGPPQPRVRVPGLLRRRPGGPRPGPAGSLAGRPGPMAVDRDADRVPRAQRGPAVPPGPIDVPGLRVPPGQSVRARGRPVGVRRRRDRLERGDRRPGHRRRAGLRLAAGRQSAGRPPRHVADPRRRHRSDGCGRLLRPGDGLLDPDRRAVLQPVAAMGPGLRVVAVRPATGRAHRPRRRLAAPASGRRTAGRAGGGARAGPLPRPAAVGTRRGARRSRRPAGPARPGR